MPPIIHLSTLWSKFVQYVDSDRVPRRFGRVLPPGRGGPLERPARKLVDRPARVLLEPVITPALRAAVAQARPSARLIRGVVLEVALRRRPAAPGPGAGRVPDLGQMPQPAPGIMTPGLEPVIAVLRGDRIEADQQVRPGSGGAQSPGPSFGGGGEREPGPVAGAGSGAFPVALGFGPGAAVPDGVSLPVGHRHAPRRLEVAGGRNGQVAGQPWVDGPDPGDLTGPVGQPGGRRQRHGQRNPPGAAATEWPGREY